GQWPRPTSVTSTGRDSAPADPAPVQNPYRLLSIVPLVRSEPAPVANLQRPGSHHVATRAGRPQQRAEGWWEESLQPACPGVQSLLGSRHRCPSEPSSGKNQSEVTGMSRSTPLGRRYRCPFPLLVGLTLAPLTAGADQPRPPEATTATGQKTG